MWSSDVSGRVWSVIAFGALDFMVWFKLKLEEVK